MNTFNVSDEIQKAVEPLQNTINQLMEYIGHISQQPINADVKYINKVQLEERYGIKQSTQAKLRMDKDNGLPYVRPGGCKVVLYPVKEVEEWMQEWRAA